MTESAEFISSEAYTKHLLRNLRSESEEKSHEGIVKSAILSPIMAALFPLPPWGSSQRLWFNSQVMGCPKRKSLRKRPCFGFSNSSTSNSSDGSQLCDSSRCGQTFKSKQTQPKRDRI